MKRLLLVTSLATMALLICSAAKNALLPPYAHFQRAYKKVLSEQSPEVDYPIRIRQLVLPAFGRVDRCVSCHVAIEDPRMAGEENPLKAHPGDILDQHDILKVGCTVCHDGQGRALNMKDAHAVKAKHWGEKLLPGEFVQANCVRCHSEDSRAVEGMTLLTRGRDLFRAKGCLGCHKRKGKGGHIAADLTELAAASPHIKYPTEHARHELLDQFAQNVNVAYIYESVRTPKAQPVDSKMVDFGFSEDEALALSVYLKSFAVSSAPDTLRRQDVEERLDPDGRALFAMYCSACHGERGQGTRLAELTKFGPSLAHEHFQSVADYDFVHTKISRSGTSLMPAWGGPGGLTSEEVDRVSRYVLTLDRTSPPTLLAVKGLDGVARYGRILFDGKCASCHGHDGGHEIDLVGPTLNSPEMLSYADDAFIHEVVTTGRPGSAMPSWYFLSAQELADLLAWFARKRGTAPSFEAVRESPAQAQAAQWGRARFERLCASCHGYEAEGRIGPSLASPEFQALASDTFLYRTIAGGRRGTAMGAWRHLETEEIAWLIAYLRTFTSEGSEAHFAEGEVLGSESRGADTFARVCAQCHGAEGIGHIGPSITNPDFLEVAGDRFIKETACYGRSGTRMRPNLHGQGGTADLSEREINDVVAYIRSFEGKPRRYAGRSRTQGDIDIGALTFERICAQCHGALGGGHTGPAIGLPGFLAHVSDGFIEGMIANGRSGTEMKGFSPGRGGLAELSEHEIRSVVRYLRVGAATEKIPAKSVQGTAGLGEVTFKRSCAQCHGSWGEEGFAPQLTNDVFLDAARDTYLQATMSLGRHGSAMRAMMRGGGGVVELDSKDANDVIAYLRESARQRRRKRDATAMSVALGE